jgi:hypothetical protein
MKRSEMVYILAETLIEDCGLDFLAMKPIDVAKVILDQIEKEGMLPPTIRYNSVDEYSKIENTEILHDNDVSFAWEPEND